jgi:hypothetical protein
VLGNPVLRGDHGCFLLPAPPQSGYAQAALAEPWACVEAACRIRYRQSITPGGVVNVFAGLPRGTEAQLDLNPVIDGRQMRFVGSSGTSIADMRSMLVLVEQGALDTNRTVAAISGLDGVYDGIYAASQGTFSGKVVVYPHVTGLGLTPLPALSEVLPQVYAKLGPGEAWTVAAEEELLRLQL